MSAALQGRLQIGLGRLGIDAGLETEGSARGIEIIRDKGYY